MEKAAYILYDSNYMAFWKTQNYASKRHYEKGSKGQQLPEKAKWRMNRWNTGDFRAGSETVLYETIWVDTCHDTFVKTHRLYNTQ